MAMTSSFALSLDPQLDLRRLSPTELLLTSAQDEVRLELLPQVADALMLLDGSGVTEEKLDDTVKSAGGALTHLSALHYSLSQLKERGLICYTVDGSNGDPLATLTPLSPHFRLEVLDTSTDSFYQLSRFAFCRRDLQTLVLESPLSHASLKIHRDPGLYLVGRLVTPRLAKELVLVDAKNDLSERVVRELLILLTSGKFLVTSDARFAETNHFDQNHWEFHDLLFHSRSRLGRHRQAYGGTYPAGDLPPLPAVAPSISSNSIKLTKPSIEALIDSDMPFSQVVEQRCSTRRFGSEPITLEQVGEFLYRAARVRRVSADDRQELSNRPYPSGGALYELEIYLAVNSCANLKVGLYHYCPLKHELVQNSLLTSDVRSLLRLARHAADAPEIQVLVILSARFQRVAWKYESMAYALILKNVGALMQTMYLVGTAMGLGCCALGGGDSDAFARAAQTNYLLETSVGEFLLGSVPGKGD